MKVIDGIYWPESDVECHKVVPKQVHDLEKVLKLVKNNKAVVQAGGNVGIWPLYLSNEFNSVITFEPDPDNFACLTQNCKFKHNITAINAALGDKNTICTMDVTPRNVGAHQINKIFSGKQADLPAPEKIVDITTIDDLELSSCDLIVLDIEGYEPQALEGARETIERFGPVIVVEDKGLSERYGWPKGWSESFEGYEVSHRVHRDVILSPKQDRARAPGASLRTKIRRAAHTANKGTNGADLSHHADRPA